MNGKNVLYLRTVQIIWKYIERHEKIFQKMRKYLIKNSNIFQYVYPKCYPEIFVKVEKRRINLRNEFLITFKIGKIKGKK